MSNRGGRNSVAGNNVCVSAAAAAAAPSSSSSSSALASSSAAAVSRHRRRRRNVDAAVVLVPSIVAIVLYWNTLDADFAYDDSRAIKTNQDLLPSAPLTGLFFNDFWGTPLTHSGSHKSYRPLCVLSFRLNYYLGELRPYGYHLGNVLLHSIVTGLFAQLARHMLFGAGGHTTLSTWVATMLFAAHPVHTEAVAGVVGRADVGSCLFFLVALLAYIRYCKCRDGGSSSSVGGGLWNDGHAHWTTSSPANARFVYLAVSLLSAAASLLTKEHGITVLAVCAAYDILVHSRLRPKDLPSIIFEKRHRGLLEGLAALTGSVAVLVTLRLQLMGSKPPDFAPADNPAADSDSVLTRTLTFLYLPAYNFWLLLCPRWLSFDWSMEALPLVTSPLDFRNVYTAAFYAAFAHLGLYVLDQVNGSSSAGVGGGGASSNGGTGGLGRQQRAYVSINQNYKLSAMSLGTSAAVPPPAVTLSSSGSTSSSCSKKRNNNGALSRISNGYYHTNGCGGSSNGSNGHPPSALAFGASMSDASVSAVTLTASVPSAYSSSSSTATTTTQGTCSSSSSSSSSATSASDLGYWSEYAPHCSCSMYSNSHSMCSTNASSSSSWTPNHYSSWSTCSGGGGSSPAHQVDVLVVSLTILVFPFIPATNLFFYVGFVVAERVLYIPSMGFCLLIGLGVQIVHRRVLNGGQARRRRRALVVVCALLVVVFCVRTVRRNRDWLTEENLYRSGIPVNPPKAFGNLANILSAQGKKEEAEWAYKKALSYRSNMADVHYNLGILLQEQKRFEEAQQSYRLAIQFRPRMAMAHLNLGLILGILGRKEEATEVYRHCSQLDGTGLKDPKTHENTKISALFNLGRLYADDYRYAEAIEVYKEAVRKMPGHYQPQSLYNMLGEAYFKLERYEEAEHWYKEALRAKPDHIPAHLTYGKMLAKLQNRVNEAEQWFARAKLLAPNDSSVYQHYGQFLSETERHAEAANQYVRAAELAPDEYEIIFNAANTLRQAGKNEEAEKYYRMAVKLRPSEATSHMNLGAMLHVNGKLLEAELSYLEALKLKPDDGITQNNLQKLRNLLSKRGIRTTHETRR